MHMHLFNPIALRKAKIVYNFGLSEYSICICTFLTLLHSERPKLYTILAFLSAVGLKRCICIYNFGLSECSRVKKVHMHIEYSYILYTILAFLSAIGLKRCICI